VPSLWLCLWPSPASSTLASHALLAQTSLERMTSVGCRHPHRICVYVNLRTVQTIYICHSDPPNSQAILHFLITRKKPPCQKQINPSTHFDRTSICDRHRRTDRRTDRHRATDSIRASRPLRRRVVRIGHGRCE